MNVDKIVKTIKVCSALWFLILPAMFGGIMGLVLTINILSTGSNSNKLPLAICSMFLWPLWIPLIVDKTLGQ